MNRIINRVPIKLESDPKSIIYKMHQKAPLCFDFEVKFIDYTNPNELININYFMFENDEFYRKLKYYVCPTFYLSIFEKRTVDLLSNHFSDVNQFNAIMSNYMDEFIELIGGQSIFVKSGLFEIFNNIYSSNDYFEFLKASNTAINHLFEIINNLDSKVLDNFINYVYYDLGVILHNQVVQMHLTEPSRILTDPDCFIYQTEFAVTFYYPNGINSKKKGNES
jgi:hypothetical protein